jgi:glycosyltransferase involved in cell wall biosynthesis
VFEAVVAQAAMIRALGGEAPVFGLTDAHSAEDASRFAPSRVTSCPVVGPAQIGVAPRLIRALLAADLDALHLHGIWMYPSRAAERWAARTGRPLIVSPHGMLDPWIVARGRWKKALARLGYERASWRRARVLHALTPAEARDIARETGRSDAVVIPNAGPTAVPGPVAARAPEVVYIGRIHPKKNLVALAEAWARAALPPEARLTIAGWGDEADIADLDQALAHGPASARFVGPVYGAEKAALLGSARFVILPSHSEGLPVAPLEGWAAGTPAILTEQCNLPEGFAVGAAIACGHDAASIAGALEAALALDGEAWRAMAEAALALARGNFSSGQIAYRWAQVYGAALEQGRDGPA